MPGEVFSQSTEEVAFNFNSFARKGCIMFVVVGENIKPHHCSNYTIAQFLCDEIFQKYKIKCDIAYFDNSKYCWTFETCRANADVTFAFDAKNFDVICNPYEWKYILEEVEAFAYDAYAGKSGPHRIKQSKNLTKLYSASYIICLSNEEMIYFMTSFFNEKQFCENIAGHYL